MKEINKQLIKNLIQEGIRANQSFSVHQFLFKDHQSESDVNDVVDVLISKLDKETLKSHANLNRKIV